jgi:hypothetical protein
VIRFRQATAITPGTVRVTRTSYRWFVESRWGIEVQAVTRADRVDQDLQFSR